MILHLEILKRRLRGLSLVFPVFLCHCTSTPKTTPPVASKTIPFDSSDWLSENIPETIPFDTKILPVFQVSRRFAELRQGPGLEFPLLDKPLKQGELAIRLYRFQYWYKVVSPESGAKGWVHRKTLSKAKGVKKHIKLSSQALPNVFVSKPGAALYDYQSKKKIDVSLPAGYRFKALNHKGPFVLIYLPKTHSVAWIKRGHIR
ncbi:SH3 domain-containing protein [Pseudobacteriovorax antillogorgiicola]|uniref:SH3 domain-containing protein n=1 Tax=Pseudobacteriovorax antillogorgiicola TaxID=1513793 RepID=A0A1Y6CQ07_9BACT|nr:SH3 domain-containing protein [Pseudobacteriovorax antillogorgiicola]TCS46721.1 hypothetical protein EDD56_12397 [Pseudobacteriovorax antillogorgiicola]SMF67114.1 hypothetical protein SAMN06296036_12397 [Pseudobacteriovorax antillogorgiicola]